MGVPQIDYDETAVGPLDGVRVVDLGRLVAGGHCSTVLADYGADVVKVEKPGTGDEVRGITSHGVPAYWKVYGRNKRSIALDLKDERGKELLLRLVDEGDILIENFKPGTLERLGLGPEVLQARNPHLVIVRISGWGQTGPYSSRPGFGTLAEAVSGFMLRNGYADRPPVPAPTSLADMVTGLYAASAAMAAHTYATKHQEGQVVDISLFEAMFSIMGPDSLLDQLGTLPIRGEGTQASSIKGVFRCKDDKWVAISAGTESTVRQVFAAIGRPELINDPIAATYDARLANREAINGVLADWHLQHPREEVLRILQQHGATVAPLYDVTDARNDEHFQARQTIVELPDPEGKLPVIPMHNVVPRFSSTPSGIRKPAPMLGEHSENVLSELGIGSETIANLIRDGVVEGQSR